MENKSLMVLLNERHDIANQLSDSEDPVALIEKLDMAIQVKVAGIAIYLKMCERSIEQLQETKKAISNRIKMYESRIERLRNATFEAMKAHQITKVECPEHTISIQKNKPSIDVFEPKMVPIEYWKQQDPVLDRKALQEDMEAGVVVQGAKLKQTEGLRIR